MLAAATLVALFAPAASTADEPEAPSYRGYCLGEPAPTIERVAVHEHPFLGV